MNIKDKLNDAKMFFELSFDTENIKCKDIIILKDHAVFKIEDNEGFVKFQKFNFSEIKKTLSSTDNYVYCTDCTEGKELYLSLASEENSDIPDKCKDCYPYDMEDSKPLNIRTNYKPLAQN